MCLYRLWFACVRACVRRCRAALHLPMGTRVPARACKRRHTARRATMHNGCTITCALRTIGPFPGSQLHLVNSCPRLPFVDGHQHAVFTLQYCTPQIGVHTVRVLWQSAGQTNHCTTLGAGRRQLSASITLWSWRLYFYFAWIVADAHTRRNIAGRRVEFNAAFAVSRLLC